jgi:DNA-binding PadR family transcriptional regulator
MGLYLTPSYGYELIRNIRSYGFLEEQVPPGMIYRHLRQLEEEGLVSSEWKTEGSGPAKRIYHITPEGRDVLKIWVEYMEGQARKIEGFIEQYHQMQQGDT